MHVQILNRTIFDAEIELSSKPKFVKENFSTIGSRHAINEADVLSMLAQDHSSP